MKLQKGLRITVRTAADGSQQRETLLGLVHGWFNGASVLYGDGTWTDDQGVKHSEPSAAVVVTLGLHDLRCAGETFKLTASDLAWLRSCEERASNVEEVEETLTEFALSTIAWFAKQVDDANDQNCCLVEVEAIRYAFI